MKLTNFFLATVLMALGSAAAVDQPLAEKRECVADGDHCLTNEECCSGDCLWKHYGLNECI